MTGMQPERGSPERRSTERPATVLLIGKVHDGRHETACVVLNLSHVGLMARLTFVACVGQRVEIELRGMPRAMATIRWVNGAKAGMQFDRPQNLEPVFSLVEDDGHVSRPPRFGISMEAVVRLASRQFHAQVVNISPAGLCLSADAPVEPGETGQIILAACNFCLFGTVRWVNDRDFGFHLTTPLPLKALRECLEC